MGPRKCFLCGEKRSQEVSLHRIPKVSASRAAWVKFCGLNENYDDISKVVICSNHFTLNDYLEPKAKELGSILKLKPNSVPSLLGSHDDISELEIGSNHFTLNNDIKPNAEELSNMLKFEVDSDASVLESPCPTNSNIKFEPNSDPSILESPCPIMPNIKFEPDSDPSILESPCPTMSSIKVELPEVESFTVLHEVFQTPKKRFSEPRYVGDVATPDFSTPQRAERSFNLAKTKISEQASKIKFLQQKNRRLTKRIHDLTRLVDYLKSKKLITENLKDR